MIFYVSLNKNCDISTDREEDRETSFGNKTILKNIIGPNLRMLIIDLYLAKRHIHPMFDKCWPTV